MHLHCYQERPLASKSMLKHEQSRRGGTPVDLMTEYGSPELRTAVSPAYLWFRVPPGFSCTMGISFLRASADTTLLETHSRLSMSVHRELTCCRCC